MISGHLLQIIGIGFLRKENTPLPTAILFIFRRDRLSFRKTLERNNILSEKWFQHSVRSITKSIIDSG